MNESFQLPMAFNLAATFFFAVTGALAALRRHYDVVGLFALAAITGIGGGLIRDGLFIQNGPPLVVQDSRYFLVIVAACLVVVGFGQRINHLNRAFDLLDAVGLAAFCVVGTQMALAAGASVAAALLVGVINACGGGLLRDVMVREEPLVFKPGQFYVLAALFGSSLFALLTAQFGLNPPVAGLITMALTFLFRALAIYLKWSTSPILKPPSPGAAPTPPA